jgi:hypothetical protein
MCLVQRLAPNQTKMEGSHEPSIRSMPAMNTSGEKTGSNKLSYYFFFAFFFVAFFFVAFFFFAIIFLLSAE